jgi:hypothetical protein
MTSARHRLPCAADVLLLFPRVAWRMLRRRKRLSSPRAWYAMARLGFAFWRAARRSRSR